MITTMMTDDEALTDWIENSNGGAGPTPISSVERSDYEALVTAIRERDEAETTVARAVAAVHNSGASWAVIGAILGMSRQGAHKKYAKA